MISTVPALCQALTELYRSRGYEPFRMRKFEEYGLYLKNREFLLSDRVLTFTDTDGTLMALKPDVTLSIVRSTRENDRLRKVCYSESVYRPEKPGAPFREITQVGLECMGPVDGYCRLEVVLLAMESLAAISSRYVLCISQQGLLSRLLDSLGLSGPVRKEVLAAVSQKNPHTLTRLCREAGVSAGALTELADLYGTAEQTLPRLEAIFGDAPELTELRQLLSGLAAAGLADRVRLDFSLVNPMKYYNGLVFRGFVEGVPSGVLSGGQYDGLMAAMGRRCGAIGFALYPDALEPLLQPPQEALTVLLYKPDADPQAVAAAVKSLSSPGKSLLALPQGSSCPPEAKLLILAGDEVTEYA